MAEVKNSAYPADRWIRLTQIEGRLVPATPPESVGDPLQAYRGFLYASEDEVKTAIAQEMSARWGEVADKKRDFDDADIDGAFGPCVVMEDGTIEVESGQFARAEIFSLHNVEDPHADPVPSL
jgi:hypothetical protein